MSTTTGKPIGSGLGGWFGHIADTAAAAPGHYGRAFAAHRRRTIVLTVLTALGHVQVWHLIVLSLWLGIVSAFDIPVRQSLYVHLVDDRADLPNAIALNSFLVNGARVVGPALAGLLLAVVSEAVCFALNALSFVAVIVAVTRMHFPREPGPAARHDSWWSSWVEGFRYVWEYPPARALLTLVAVLAWTIAPYSSLMPIYAKDVYGGGPHTLGFLLAAAGGGALLSTGYLAGRDNIRGLMRVIALAAATSGVALAEKFSAQAAFAINGVVAALAAAWFWRRMPAIRAALRPAYQKLGILGAER